MHERCTVFRHLSVTFYFSLAFVNCFYLCLCSCMYIYSEWKDHKKHQDMSQVYQTRWDFSCISHVLIQQNSTVAFDNIQSGRREVIKKKKALVKCIIKCFLPPHHGSFSFLILLSFHFGKILWLLHLTQSFMIDLKGQGGHSSSTKAQKIPSVLRRHDETEMT